MTYKQWIELFGYRIPKVDEEKLLKHFGMSDAQVRELCMTMAAIVSGSIYREVFLYGSPLKQAQQEVAMAIRENGYVYPKARYDKQVAAWFLSL